MHCLFSNGIVGQEMHLVLQMCSQHLSISYSHMEEYCKAGWKTPKHTGQNVAADVFSSRREKASHDNCKAIASELLEVHPLVRHFIETIVRPRCPDIMRDALASFSMLSKAVAQINAMKKNKGSITRDSCDKLKDLFRKHLQLFQHAYGSEEVRPKHHLCQHIPDQIFAHGFLIDCWPCERKHKSLKRLATMIDNTSDFEKSLLARAITEQLDHTPAQTFSFALLGATTPAPDLAEKLGAVSVAMATRMRLGIIMLATADVIISDGKAMRILACMQVDATFCALVMLYSFERHVGAGTLWKPSNQTACFTIAADTFVVPTHWTFQSDSMMLTLQDE
jgi:hypothetical protein